MRSFLLLTWLVFVGLASATRNIHRLQGRASNNAGIPEVPNYNFTMPVDHFDSNNKQTYHNRFFVNNTYYKAGGPVILYSGGERGISKFAAAEILAGFNVSMSAPLELAKRLGGLAIMLEHRYYGTSLPVAFNNTNGLTASTRFNGGLPEEGANGYRYLTVEQALEDVVLFANRFNETNLATPSGNFDTKNLDPYHTPWIAVGGSYSGTLAAYLRIRNPEIVYASWSSSAPVEARYDGSIYFNPIYRSLPANCSMDVKAIIASFNEIVNSGNASQIDQFKQKALGMFDNSVEDIRNTSIVLVANQLAQLFYNGYQSYGPQHTTQFFCDQMESFDGQAFLSNASSASTNVSVVVDTIFSNPGNAQPSDRGIVAANGDNGIEIGQAAYLYAADKALDNYFHISTSNYHSNAYPPDSHSWIWQTLTEIGAFLGYNATSNADMEIVMAAVNTTAYRQANVDAYFAVYDPSVFPAQPNVDAVLKYGGWDMTPSNVMFTNGELDPWRGFGVSSEEQHIGAPKRDLTQQVPDCNKAPGGSQVFGLLYGGATHVEDLLTREYSGNEDEQNPPVKQGLDLFSQAYEEWRPCFEKSRDAVRNGKNPDGGSKDNTNGVGMLVPNQHGLMAAIGSAFMLMYSVL